VFEKSVPGAATVVWWKWGSGDFVLFYGVCHHLGVQISNY